MYSWLLLNKNVPRQSETRSSNNESVRIYEFNVLVHSYIIRYSLILIQPHSEPRALAIQKACHRTCVSTAQYCKNSSRCQMWITIVPPGSIHYRTKHPLFCYTAYGIHFENQKIRKLMDKKKVAFRKMIGRVSVPLSV